MNDYEAKYNRLIELLKKSIVLMKEKYDKMPSDQFHGDERRQILCEIRTFENILHIAIMIECTSHPLDEIDVCINEGGY